MSRAPIVYVFGPGSVEYKIMFIKRGFKGTNNPLSADFLCLTGGEDVCPALYAEPTLKNTYCNIDRDKLDIEMFEQFQEQSKPCIGICRGGQFINVANGGKMWQDVNNHAIAGAHDAVDLDTGRVIRVSSTHHQMMRPTIEAQIVMTANLATKKIAAKDWWLENVKLGEGSAAPKGYVQELYDVEACYYHNTKSLCFQPHPEYLTAPTECTDFFFELLQRHFDLAA